MTTTPRFPGGVWFVDFEFRPAHGREGNPPSPVCLVAHELVSGRTLRQWLDNSTNLPRECPFPVDDSALTVAYYASAEMACFQELAWPTPVHTLDLYAEFRVATNGKPRPCGNGLLGALAYFGLPSLLADEKAEMRTLILRGGPYSVDEQQAILDYCASDVMALEALFKAMAAHIDWPRALLRGQYAVAVAAMERRGIPLDLELYRQLTSSWDELRHHLIAEVDQRFQVFDGGSFRAARFADYLRRQGWVWPRLASGRLDLSDDTFGEMAALHPELQPLRQLRQNLGQFRAHDWPVGGDGRVRCLLSMFSAKTGRNQPSTSRFVFGASAWLRSLIQPPPGYGLAYVDWSQQEFGIAAALSGDAKMMTAYASGDPYLAFAKQAGAVPEGATKASHPHERGLFKQCVLAVQYGMGEETLALRIGQPVAQARKLLALHRETYCDFWAWSDRCLDVALLQGRLQTSFGWQLHVHGKINQRSVRNFPVQANGAEMLRIACILLHQAGIHVCAPIHDAVLIEAPLAELDATVARTQDILRQASLIVLDGFALESDAQVIRYPDHFEDERGTSMWSCIAPLLASQRPQAGFTIDERSVA